jgi:hypothetical protein
MVGAKIDGYMGRYAMADSNPDIFIVPDEMVKKLNIRFFDVRDKTIPSFQEEMVKKMMIELPGNAPFVLVRKGEEKWRLQEPVRSKTDTLRVKSLIWRLVALRYEEIISKNSENDELYGFDKPNAKVTLWGEDESRPLEIFFLGKSTMKEKYIYIRIHSKPGVFTTEADILDKIPDSVEKLKSKL